MTKPTRQEQEPADSAVTEVGPGVLRMQLPVHLPGLGHVNCYAIEDERGVAIVDPGLPGDPTWDVLAERLAQGGFKPTDVHTVIITHSHFDHFGQAERLREEVGAQIVTHANFRSMWSTEELDERPEVDPDMTDAELEIIAERTRRRLPWGSMSAPPPIEEIRRFAQMGGKRSRMMTVPEPTMRIEHADVLPLGRGEWLAIHTPGHTADHLCLYDPVSGVFLSGDHVLPTITPHIGGTRFDEDPLQSFFDSLRLMHDYADVSVVLPAHGHPFDDLVGRADDIVEHHEERLQVIRDAAAGSGSAPVEHYMQQLFRERSWGEMAASETYAHLEHLRLQGDVTCAIHDGIHHYDLTSS